MTYIYIVLQHSTTEKN